jgi:hypothetical protein
MKPYPYAWMNSWNIKMDSTSSPPGTPFSPYQPGQDGWDAGKASNTTAGDSYVAGEATQGFALSTNQAKQASQQRLIQLLLGTFPGMGVLQLALARIANRWVDWLSYPCLSSLLLPTLASVDISTFWFLKKRITRVFPLPDLEIPILELVNSNE